MQLILILWRVARSYFKPRAIPRYAPAQEIEEARQPEFVFREWEVGYPPPINTR